MTEYRFRLLLADRSEHGECFMCASSDEEACKIAESLLWESTCTIVEISRDGRVIYTTGKLHS